MTTPGPTDRRLELAATGALVGLTVATLVGLGRLLVDTTFMAPVITAALVAHGASWGARRLGWGVVRAVGLSLAAGVVTILLLRYGSELTGGGLLRAIETDLREAWNVFQDEGAPAPVADGFVVAAMFGAVLIATASDALAFRVGAPAEAIAPAAGLFLFTTVLGGPDHEVSATLLFLAAVLGFSLMYRVARLASAQGWLRAPRGRGAEGLLRAGTALTAVGLAGGLLLGPALPGADADPIIDLDPDGDGRRVTISPLVDIQSRLVDQPDVEAFTVRSDGRSYWRLTALDQFDGSIWSAGGDYLGADGPLPRSELSEARPVERRRIEQRIEIKALSAIWLPAAYEATSVDAGDVDVEWNPAASTLVVDAGRDSADAVTYAVTSEVPVITQEVAADVEPSGPALDPLRQLPGDFSAGAAATAREVTAGSTTPYRQALALQDFFRTRFEYSLDVSAGHSVADIDEFLAARVGYCEQFSGAYAAMARSIGLPARVAVGFTPGEADPDDPGLFHVRGEHAHAWPEVHLGALGWVPFEPTPGRGAPGAEAYTGVTEQQQGEAAPGVPAPTTTLAPTVTTPAGDTAVTQPTTDESAPAPTAPSEDQGPNWRIVLLIGGLVVAVAWTAGAPLLRRIRREAARRRTDGRPGQQVALAWRESAVSLGRAGIHRRPSESPLAFGQRLVALFDDEDLKISVDALATSVTALWFGGEDQLGPHDASRARAASEQIEQQARDRAGGRRWWISGLNPRLFYSSR